MKEVVSRYSDGGVKKARMPFARMLVSAFFAGMFIALAGAAATIGSATAEGSYAKLLSAVIFPAGLAMVIANGSELFTGNCLLVISLLDKKIKLHELARNWFTVYLGNFLGSLFVAALASYGHMYGAFGGRAGVSAVSVAAAKCGIAFSDGIFRGILCNVLVCVAVMMALMAEGTANKIITLFLPIMAFVLCGFEHSVANMSYISTGLMLKGMGVGGGTETLSLFGFLVTNLVPVTIGNILGGGLVGTIYWYLAKTE